MNRKTSNLTRIGVVAVLAACLVLTACGRRGPPEAPVTYAPAATAELA